jgi:hypothetical protein
MVGFRAAFPELNFWGAADLITPTSSYASYDHRKATARRLNDHAGASGNGKEAPEPAVRLTK